MRIRQAATPLLALVFTLNCPPGLRVNATAQEDETYAKVERIASRAEKRPIERLGALQDELLALATRSGEPALIEQISKASAKAGDKARLVYGQAVLRLASTDGQVLQGADLLLSVLHEGVEDRLGELAANALRKAADPSQEKLTGKISAKLQELIEGGNLPGRTRIAVALALSELGSASQHFAAVTELRLLLASSNVDLHDAAALAIAEAGDIDEVRKDLERLRDQGSTKGRIAALYLELDGRERIYKKALSRLNDRLRKSNGESPAIDVKEVRLLERILDMIRTQHVHGDQFDRKELIEAAARGMLNVLDPHSTYISGEEYKRFIFDLNQDYGGIGAFVNTIAGVFQIIRPIYSGPAYKAGLRSGDAILAVDGWSTSGRSNDEIIKRLKGKPGTAVLVRIYRPGFTEPRDIEIQRAQINVPVIQYELLPGAIGYVELISFTRNADHELERAVQDLLARGMKGLVLDLRNNTGGFLDVAVDVANVFLPRGKLVVKTVSRLDADGMLRTRRKPLLPTEVPVAVLVNRRSASASEIVAGALQDHGRALIVGERSFGKGTVQQLIRLFRDERYEDINGNHKFDEYEPFQDTNPNGKPGVYDYAPRIKLTTAEYYLPGGRSINTQYDKQGRIIAKGGIQPDDPIDARRLPLWQLQELDQLVSKNAFRNYVDAHFDAHKKLFVELAEGDRGDTSRYPDFEKFFTSLGVKTLSRNDVRRWIRLRVREKVSDVRGKVFPGYRFDGDFEEDLQLQKALQVVLGKLGHSLDEYPRYAKIPSELAAAEKAAKRDAEEAKKKNG